MPYVSGKIFAGVASGTHVECTFLHKPRSTLCRNLHPMWRFTRKFRLPEPTTEPTTLIKSILQLTLAGPGGNLTFCRCPWPGIDFNPRSAPCTRDPGDKPRAQLPCGPLSVGDSGRGQFSARYFRRYPFTARARQAEHQPDRRGSETALPCPVQTA